MLKTITLAILLLAAALPAAAQSRADIRPEQPMRLDVPNLYHRTVRASFVRLDSTTLYVVTQRSRGDTLAIPLELVRLAEVRTDSLQASGARNRGLVRGARNGLVFGSAMSAIAVGLGAITGDIEEAGDFVVSVALPFTAATTGAGALLGFTFGASEVWTPVDLSPAERRQALEAAASRE